MKKILYLSIFLLSVLMISCKPDPIDNGDDDTNNNDTIHEEPLVKKYLTKQLLNDDPERIILSIDWNEDCSQIKNVKYGTGNKDYVNYDFTYYESDSIVVTLSIVPYDGYFSYPIWSLYYDKMVIHLKNGNIDQIYGYGNGKLLDVEEYVYNEEGKLIERIYWNDLQRVAKDTFEWDGDNVTEAFMINGNYKYEEFTEYIHPHYTLPFYLSNEVAFEVQKPLFTPLWKNIYKNYGIIEVDGDGYLSKHIISIDEGTDSVQAYYSYYYTTPNE